MQLQLFRLGGRTTNLLVNITLDYISSLGVHDTETVLDQSEVQVFMKENEDLVTTNVELLPTAFLHIGSYFQVTVSSVELETGTLFNIGLVLNNKSKERCSPILSTVLIEGTLS